MTENTNPVQGLLDAAKATLVDLIGQANAKANRIKSAGNAAALIAEVRDSSETTDENILAYRKKMDEANNAILNWQKTIEAYIVENNLVDTGNVDVEAETTAWKALAETIKAAKGLAKNLGGEDALADLPEMNGIPGTRSAGNGASGIRRPRFQDISYTVAGKDEWHTVSETKGEGDEAKVVTNLTLLAGVLSTKDNRVTSKDLQTALFAEAKTEDLSSLAGTPVEFAFGVGDVNYIVKVTPRVSEN